MSIPEVTECIRIDSELHTQPFFKGAPVPLPQWFGHGRDCRLSRKTMLKTFLLIYSHERNSILLYLKNYTIHEHRLKKRIYSANIIRYSLLLRYTSIQSYKMLVEVFPLPSLSLLSKISKGRVDAIKYTQALKKDGKKSEDIRLFFDEMYYKNVRSILEVN